MILNSIEAWDAEFQCLLAQSLQRTLSMAQELGRPTLNSCNLAKAIELCLEFTANNDNLDVSNSWAMVFADLVYALNFID